MVWKKVSNTDSGDSTHHGGDSLDKISDAFSAQDVDDIDMACDFTFRSGKRHLRNPANTFSYNEIASAILADRNVTEPLLTGNDTRVYQAHAQTLTNKTVDTKDNFIGLRQYSSYIFKVSTTYYAVKYDGTLISSGTTAETVIQAALDLKGSIYFAVADYNITATGLTMSSDTHLEFAKGGENKSAE